MSASSPKTKKKLARKVAKRYDRVTFELDFIEGEFDLPSFKQVPTGVQRKTMKGDIDPLVDFLTANADEDVVEVFDDLDEDEAEKFLDAWSAASGVELGK